MQPDDAFKFLMHDICNNVFQALSCLDCAKLERPALASNPWLQRTSQALERTSHLFDQMSQQFKKNQPPDPEKIGFKKWHLQEYILEHAKPDLEKLQTLYDIEVEVNCNLSDKPKFVYLNNQSIKRIKENVIQNAIQAGSSKLIVNYDMQDRYYSVNFIDNGKGMSSQELDKLLLKQFNQDKIHGLGTQFLLASAEEHNFVLTYHSEPNKGTAVRFLCPYA